MSSAAQSPRGDTEEPAQSASPGREETQDIVADADAAPDNDGPMNTTDIYPDFEVKEQDRWLPIANGESPAGALHRALRNEWMPSPRSP